MAAWSLGSSLVGIGLAVFTAMGRPLDLFPMSVAIITVVLMQYVAHPLNDMMDYDLDRQAPIPITGRKKPLVDKMIDLKETKILSAFVLLIIIAAMAYLIVRQPLLLVPAAYGSIALVGYNSSRLRLAYRPFTELYLSMPINAITVFVVAYIGSGEVTIVTVLVSIIYGFAASSFFVSMMSMDFPTDRINGKRTTVVTFPRSRWCTIYPMIGSLLVLASPFLLEPSMGSTSAIFFLLLSAPAFIALIAYGRAVDDIRIRYLDGESVEIEGPTGKARLNQLYCAVVYALVLSAFFLLLGGAMPS